MNHTPTAGLDPYDADRPLRLRCACGRDHGSPSERTAEATASEGLEQTCNRYLEAALIKAIFPRETVRRAFLKAVGRSTAVAAIGSVLPIGTLQALAQERATPEKKDLKIGFVSITCATPLLMAEPLGSYRDQGINVQLVKTPGWALIRDRVIKKEHDASHFLSPMPLAMSLGLGSAKVATSVATIQNINGQAITLHIKHKGRRDPKQWKGFKLGVPFVYSMHNFLLRYYVAEHGLNPDTDIEIRIVPPPEMVAKLRDGEIDGFLGPDPYNQRAVYDEVGFIHVLSKDIWDGHPCCAFGMTEDFIQRHPNSFAAMFRAIISASFIASVSTDRTRMAKLIAPPAYLNQPEAVVAQVLTGEYPDGLGNIRKVPDRAIFDPVPWQSMAVWMLTQMKRWGYLKGDVDYSQIAEKVFMLTDAKKQMGMAGWRPPEGAYRKAKIMGKVFDPARPDDYLKSFAIHHTA
ncbi:CmpA/NrtA family ABC transporter substrate-binding protein [Caldimonas brevitalea]|uniref:Nitrate ABC transporter substrate-binding protein n=1 Tax=Caldimonas brevitalea TaxID=413882 RepID=A0A0G3BSN2_9BURK|nr:CmpA/NrtA family ABC transporter substrate-binding protein [Caldimonas brevitalea]AKJ30386.1 nitrate ABC transporter substrate-binding protein [Caldimonas brevitalea]